MRRVLQAVALLAGFSMDGGSQILLRDEKAPEKVQLLGLAIRMRDGTRLATDVFLPGDTGRWPTILVRTPYDRKATAMLSYRFFVPHGYAVVIQDVRGRSASEGIIGDTSQEGPDGNDTINWIAAQPWSDGRVGMAGGSYLGMVQWWAALQDNPHLLTISPASSGNDEYTDRFYSQGGAMQIGHRLLWLAENLTPPSHVRPLFESYIGHVPLTSADIMATGTVLPLWRETVRHPSYDSYWKRLSVRERIKLVKVPVLSWGGWFDEYAESDLDSFARLAKQKAPVETWIGPWAHDSSWRFPTRDFGKLAQVPIRHKQLAWFDRWLKGKPEMSDVDRVDAGKPKLHLFVMGPDVWREEHEWPLSRQKITPLYLASGGHANSIVGDGSLQWHPVREASPDVFIYDPKRPVPTAGGAICCDPLVLPPGPLLQTKVERRADVLIYTSPPLREELEVTGTIRSLLYVATSANDTDFTAKLVDVDSAGRPLLVTDGIQRLRYRLSNEKPVFVKRNSSYQITIDLGVTSYAFASGHSIRLEVSSSNFPRFDRNLNTTRPVAEENKFSVAKQTVYHERAYPSVLLLPVIPRINSRHREVRVPSA